MKIDVNTVLTTLDGTPIKNEKGEDATFKPMAITALLTETGKEPLAGDKKWENFQLATKINDADGEVELTLEEAKTIQDQVEKTYTTLVYGRIRQLLND